MKYQEFPPSSVLKPYVKCFYLVEHELDVVVNDRAFAMGCLEFMFNLSDGAFETGRGTDFSRTPKAELWGQIIRPLNYRSLGKNKLLGVRFFPHTASLFIKDPISLFNDSVGDIVDVAGKDAEELHEKLYETQTLTDQIQLLETFLINRLVRFEKKQHKFQLVNDVMEELKRDDFFENMEGVALRYGISARYLQKLFLEYTGLTPKLFQKINRFQKSLLLTGKKDKSLTSIAYSCGYFDQSHFVRDFKFFSEMTPSAFDPKNSSALLISPNN
jgi:AraC-like DNA-binding protein